MLTQQFWEIIERSRTGYVDCEDQFRKLCVLLEALAPADIVSFDTHLRTFLVLAYRWDLWAAAHIVRGGCSDEDFEAFRLWLIGQGQEAFESVLEFPDALLDYLTEEEDPVCEALLYAAGEAYEAVTGRGIPISEVSHPLAPDGEPWDEDDLADLLPELSEAFS